MEKKPSIFKSRKKLMLVVIIVIVIAALLLILYQLQKSVLSSFVEAPPELIMLERTSLESKVTASGNFESLDPVTIGSNVVGGEVDAVYVSAGDQVYAGEVLATLKTTDLLRSIADTRESIAESSKSDSLRISQAQRALNEARDQYNIDYNQNTNEVNKAWDRWNKANEAAKIDIPVIEAQIAGETDLDKIAKLEEAIKQIEDGVNMALDAYQNASVQRDNQARNDSIRIQDAQDQLNSLTIQNNSRQSKTQLESLEEDLSNAQIVSSISGVVTAVNTESGRAAAGSMFVIENTEMLQIAATIAEYDVIKVAEGMEAHVSSNALGSQQFEGVVDYVAPIASDTQGNFEVRVTVTSPVGQLRPGMTATIEIVTASKKDVFAVPIDAVVTKPNGTKVVYAYEPNATVIPVRQDPPEGEERDLTSDESMSREITDGPQIIVSSDMSAAPSFSRREIVVTTGMETDYYIEISSDELTEGMLLLSDPEGKNVVPADMGGYGTMMGGPGMSSSVTVVDSGSTRGEVAAVRLE